MKARDRQRLEELYGNPGWVSASAFGWFIGRSAFFVYERIRRGEVRGVRKIAGCIRVPYASMNEWIEKHSEPLDPRERQPFSEGEHDVNS